MLSHIWGIFSSFSFSSFSSFSVHPPPAKFYHIRPYLAKILPNSSKFCQILPISTKFCQVLPNSARFCQILPNSAKFCQILPISAKLGHPPSFQEEEEKIPHMCESIGHRPLRGRCPAPSLTLNHKLLKQGTGTADHLTLLRPFRRGFATLS